MPSYPPRRVFNSSGMPVVAIASAMSSGPSIAANGATRDAQACERLLLREPVLGHLERTGIGSDRVCRGRHRAAGAGTPSHSYVTTLAPPRCVRWPPGRRGRPRRARRPRPRSRRATGRGSGTGRRAGGRRARACDRAGRRRAPRRAASPMDEGRRRTGRLGCRVWAWLTRNHCRAGGVARVSSRLRQRRRPTSSTTPGDRVVASRPLYDALQPLFSAPGDFDAPRDFNAPRVPDVTAAIRARCVRHRVRGRRVRSIEPGDRRPGPHRSRVRAPPRSRRGRRPFGRRRRRAPAHPARLLRAARGWRRRCRRARPARCRVRLPRPDRRGGPRNGAAGGGRRVRDRRHRAPRMARRPHRRVTARAGSSRRSARHAPGASRAACRQRRRGGRAMCAARSPRARRPRVGRRECGTTSPAGRSRRSRTRRSSSAIASLRSSRTSRIPTSLHRS